MSPWHFCFQVGTLEKGILMRSKNYQLPLFIAILLLVIIGCEKETLYMESFEKNGSPGFKTINIAPIDGEKILMASSGEKVWRWNLDCQVKEDTTLSWYWTGITEEDYTFFVKLLFTGHRTIYYVATGSRNPVAQGERYRAKDGRMRFSPGVVICGLPFSPGNWVRIKRAIGFDYLKYCGILSRDVKLKEIQIYMVTKRELGIDGIMVKG